MQVFSFVGPRRALVRWTGAIVRTKPSEVAAGSSRLLGERDHDRKADDSRWLRGLFQALDHPGGHRLSRRFGHLTIEMLEARCLLATVLWNGGGDGTFWHDPKNWSTGQVPGQNDDVVINVPENKQR